MKECLFSLDCKPHEAGTMTVSVYHLTVPPTVSVASEPINASVLKQREAHLCRHRQHIGKGGGVVKWYCCGFLNHIKKGVTQKKGYAHGKNFRPFPGFQRWPAYWSEGGEGWLPSCMSLKTRPLSLHKIQDPSTSKRHPWGLPVYTTKSGHCTLAGMLLMCPC